MTPKRTYKFGTKSFFENTPSLFRRIGNMFFSISSLGGTFAFLLEDKKIGFILFAMGAVGKVLTEFFSQEEVEKDYDTDTDATPVDASTVMDSLNPLPEIVAAVKVDKVIQETPIVDKDSLPQVSN